MERAFIARTGKVGLSILNREDVPALWKMLTDIDVNRFLNARWRIHYLENEFEWYDSLRKNSDSERAFGICLDGTDEIIGAVFLVDLHFKNRNSFIGYFLSKKYWGKGITTEAVKLLIKYAFNELNLRKLYTSVFEPNEGSHRILEKLGFQKAGRYHSHIYIPGKGFVDELMYELFNDDVKEELGK